MNRYGSEFFALTATAGQQMVANGGPAPIDTALALMDYGLSARDVVDVEEMVAFDLAQDEYDDEELTDDGFDDL